MKNSRFFIDGSSILKDKIRGDFNSVSQPPTSISNMKLLLMLSVSLFLCTTVQAKLPADGLIKTATSGVIQGKSS